MLKEVTYDGYTHQLSFWYSESDLVEIGLIKKKISALFSDKNYQSDSLYQSIDSFARKQRKPFIFQEKWFTSFLGENRNLEQEGLQGQVDSYLNFKNNFLNKQNLLLKLFRTPKASFQCLHCSQHIFDLDDLQVEAQKFQRKAHRSSLWCLKKFNFKGDLHFLEKFPQYKEYLKKMEEIHGEYESYFCCHQDHLLLLQDSEQNIYLPCFAKVQIEFSDGSTEEYEHYNFESERIKFKQDKAFKFRENEIRDYQCKICDSDEYLDNYQKFYKHLQTKDHKEEQQEFEKFMLK